MSTLQIIKEQAQAAIDKANRGESLTSSDINVLRIHNSLYSKKAGNAGKRKIIKTGK